MHRKSLGRRSLVVLVLSLAAVAGTAGAGTRSTEGPRHAGCGPSQDRNHLLAHGAPLGVRRAVPPGPDARPGVRHEGTRARSTAVACRSSTSTTRAIRRRRSRRHGSDRPGLQDHRRASSSGVALQVAPLAAQNKVLFISPAATDAITGSNRYTFRLGRQSTQDVLAVKGILGKGVGTQGRRLRAGHRVRPGQRRRGRAILGGAGPHRQLDPRAAVGERLHAVRAAGEAGEPDLLFVAWAGTTAPAMWRALEQQGVIRGTTVATGLAERATWDPATCPG